MRTWLFFKSVFLVVCCTLLFGASLLTSTNSAHAQATRKLTAGVSPSRMELDSYHCTTTTVWGRGFTPSSFTANYALFNATDQYNNALTVNPARVTIPMDGSFITPVSLCWFTPFPTEAMNFTMVDGASGRMTGPLAMTVYAPLPSISVSTQTVSLVNGCATLTVMGNNFIPPGFGSNTAYLYATLLGRRQSLSGSPAASPVFGGGNIATTVTYCGLLSGDTFMVKAMDGVSWLFSNNVVLQAV